MENPTPLKPVWILTCSELGQAGAGIFPKL